MLNQSIFRKILTALLVGMAVMRIGHDFAFGMGISIVLALAAAILSVHAVYPRWHLWMLGLYLAVPFPMIEVALLGLVSFITGIRLSLQRYTQMFVIGMAISMTFLLYWATLSPGMLPADAGEFQTVVATWGVAHPPGYTLYTILAGSFSHILPFKSMAWRVNLFSALTGAATAGVIAWAIYRENGRLWQTWGAVLSLITATTVWMTSTQASIRPMALFFTAVMLEASLAYRIARQHRLLGRTALFRFGIAAGFGVVHHGSIFFLGCILAVWIALADRGNWRQWWVAPCVASLGLIPLLYLPLQADHFLAPAGLNTVDGILNHVLARGFAGDMFAFAAPVFWQERWHVLIEILRLQWHIYVFVLAVLGWFVIVLYDRWLGSLLFVGVGVHLFVSVTYRSPQTVEYALPAYLLVSLTLGVVKLRPRLTSSLYSILIITTVAFGFYDGWRTMRRLSSVEETRIIAERLLNRETGTILSQWHWATPLWYLQQAEHLASDKSVSYVITNQFPSPMDAWAEAIETSLTEADAIQITQHFPERYRFLPYSVTSEMIYSNLPDVLEQGMQIGPHRVDVIEIPDLTYAGENIRFTLRWEIARSMNYGDLTTFIHIGLPESPPIAQLDAPMQIHKPGVIDVSYDVFVPHTTPPGYYQLFVGAYTPEETLLNADYEERTHLGEAWIAPAQFPLPSIHPLSINLSGLRLIGWDYDRTNLISPRLYLHWYVDVPHHKYDLLVENYDSGFKAMTAFDPKGQYGYWTSVHELQNLVRDIQITVDDDTVNLRLPDTAMYVVLDDVGVLVGADMLQGANELILTIDWLGTGATLTEMTASVGVSTDKRTFIHNWTPISGALPTLKWRYGHVLHDSQRIPLNESEHIHNIHLDMFDSFTGQPLATTGQGAGGILLFSDDPPG